MKAPLFAGSHIVMDDPPVYYGDTTFGITVFLSAH
jgi:hypothetical protein